MKCCTLRGFTNTVKQNVNNIKASHLYLTKMLKIRSLYRHCWREYLYSAPFAAGAGRTDGLMPVKTGQATSTLCDPLLPLLSCRVGCHPQLVRPFSGPDTRWWPEHLPLVMWNRNTAISRLTSVIRSWKSDVLNENANRDPISHYFKYEKL
jgi:hypothetical protein